MLYVSVVSKDFYSFLAPFGSLDKRHVDQLLSTAEEVNYKKGDYFIREGETGQRIGFLLSGVARVYHHANDKEYTSYFNFPERNRLVASFESFLTGKPSKENIHFLTDARLIVFSRASLDTLYAESQAFSELGRKLAEYNYLLAMKRIFSLQHDTAQLRYVQLLDIYPDLVNTIPHHYIASYLGITPESLSRIRKELAR